MRFFKRNRKLLNFVDISICMGQSMSNFQRLLGKPKKTQANHKKVGEPLHAQNILFLPSNNFLIAYSNKINIFEQPNKKCLVIFLISLKI